MKSPRILAIAAACVLASFASTASAQAPTLHYDFEDESDPTVNLGTLGTPAYDGDVTGNPVYVPFQFGSALQFDGTGDHVTPAGPESAFDIGDFTLVATIQTSHSQALDSHRFIIAKQNTATNPTYSLAVQNDTGLAKLGIADGTRNLFASSSAPVNDGEPHELVGMRKGNLLMLFVDGAQNGVATIPPGFGSTDNDNSLLVGGRTFGGGDGTLAGDFIGIIDDVRVYDFALIGTAQVAKAIAADAEAGDQFGAAAAVDGDTAVVGAQRDDDAGSESGAAYVLARNQGGANAWGQVQKLVADDGAAGDQFGGSVSIDGDTAVVGAYLNDAVGADSGAVYVFERNAGGPDTWGQVQKLVASDAATDDLFGFSVSISGATVVVGALAEDEAGIDSGSAYVFERNEGGSDSWGEVQKLTASDAGVSDFFGCAVSISGDALVVGPT